MYCVKYECYELYCKYIEYMHCVLCMGVAYGCMYGIGYVCVVCLFDIWYVGVCMCVLCIYICIMLSECMWFRVCV